MSMLNKPIDVKVLENELDDALRADELYKLQNAAKFRAIEQRVPTYDHFRNMVMTAHLKPLDRGEMQRRPDVSWNHCCSKNDKADGKTWEKSSLSTSSSSNNDKTTEINLTVQTPMEFGKIWRTLNDSEQKFQLLCRNRQRLKSKIFRTEVPSDLLEEFIKLSLEIIGPETISEIVDILQIFSECNRFSLSLAMLSASARPSVRLLFEKLQSSIGNEEAGRSLERLVNIYQK